MALFDRYIAVDWSASNQPKQGKDSIWSCDAPPAESDVKTTNHRTRHAAEAWLCEQLTEAVVARQRVLLGFDFPYGYPAGFARALGLDGWEGIWEYLERHVRDNDKNVSNRFEVAAEINRALGRDAPFWGRPAHLDLPALPAQKRVRYRGVGNGGFAEWRQVEAQLRHRRTGPQTVWKLAYTGAVGSQSLVGIPVLRRLLFRKALREVSRVWPFQLGVPELPSGSPAIIHAEIWPSIVPFGHEHGSCRDEQQVRAVVHHWRGLDRGGRLGELFAAPENRSVRREEGWILGVPTDHSRPLSRPAWGYW